MRGFLEVPFKVSLARRIVLTSVRKPTSKHQLRQRHNFSLIFQGKIKPSKTHIPLQPNLLRIRAKTIRVVIGVLG